MANGIGMTGYSPQLSGGTFIDQPINANFAPQSAPKSSPSYSFGGGAAGAGGGIGMVAGGPVGAAIGVGVGSLIDIGMSLYGQHKQDEVNEKNRALAEKWAQIQNEIAAKQSARQWQWLEEDRDYKQALDFQANLDKMMNTDIGLKNSLVTLWRRAA